MHFSGNNTWSAGLQVRKVLELIAFASLIANVQEYSRQYSEFSKHWNARYMLRDLARINPDFYPQPIVQAPSQQPGLAMEWNERPDDYLSRDRFEIAYEQCGGLMHADNPYGSLTDLDGYKSSIKAWRNQIVNLLNAHTISLSGETNLYLFQMGAGLERPSYTPFGLVDDESGDVA
ncbi:hypothetical protein KBY66_14590 [Synechococcus sp. Tobar12-5m-g]|uniref:hypothetical protein n=1 Tax=unclassified Synechococcus TaxID=2626047 RepID=UPI0020CE6FF1|nr:MULTISPECIES: hypothetical protein [unclassified Synechococcus]MCP9773824.1 hypothetical protein [Synechococcus sp. Tobar12-5m-g]MCP9874839.1 hypothetical protein [Synechococcus sp. Cruz CV-v-12]